MSRPFVLFIAALAALLGSLITVFDTTDQLYFNLRGYEDATQNAHLPYRIPRLGVNVELTQYTSSEIEQNLSRIEEAHITWIRQIFPWDDIEPQPGQYQWEQWDTIIQSVALHPNLRLIAVLGNTPYWARPPLSPDTPATPPEDMTTFGVFASEFARRYQETIDVYQIWDEPNLNAAWGGLDPHPADYAALLQTAYYAIHGADPNAQVILGALAPTTETGPRNISDIQYLRDLYALGANHYMDAAAAKPYGFDFSPEDRTVQDDRLNFSRIVALREIMVANGDGDKMLWASNWGWNSLPDDWTGQPSIWGQVTHEQQITYTLQALERAEREWPWLGGMILHQWQPVVTPDDPQWGFALVNQDDQPGRLWEALTNRDQNTSASNGLFHPQTAYARYSGVWTFSALGADIGWLNDSQLEFDFSGRAVALLLRKDDYTAYLYPTIDGEPANALPQDSPGHAYIVLTSATRTPELTLVQVANNLSDSQHTLRLTADRGWDRWALAGYAVSSGDLAKPFTDQIAISWMATAISALATIIIGWSLPWRQIITPFRHLARMISGTGQIIISLITSLALLLGMMLTWGDGTPHIFKKDAVQMIVAMLTAGVIYLEPGFLLTIAAAVILFVVIYNRLDIGLTLVVFWSPFFLFPVELYRFAFPIAELLILITTTAWVIHQFVNWGQLRQSGIRGAQFPYRSLNALDLGVAAWLLLGVVSLTWAAYRAQAVTDLRVMIVEPALFYMMLRTSRLDRQAIIRLVDALILAGLVVAIIGLWTFFQGEGVITAEAGTRRLASVYGSPNNVGLFLGRCIPFVLSYLIIATDRSRRILASIILPIMLVVVMLSQSAGAIFIGVPVAIITVLLLVWRQHTRKIIITVVAAAAGLFLVSLRSARFARVLDFTSGTNFFRLRVWQSALNIIHDRPLTGLGLDQFLYAFRSAYILPDAWQEPNLSHPHNLILDFWTRLGIGGVLILVWLQVTFWKQTVRVYQQARTRQNPYLFALIVGTMGSMANLISHGLIDNSVFVQDLSLIFVLLLGLVKQLSNISAID